LGEREDEGEKADRRSREDGRMGGRWARRRARGVEMRGVKEGDVDGSAIENELGRRTECVHVGGW
jgi:hypothetical protein